MFDSSPVRHRCRNPRCKVRLKEPVKNPRDAFCCASCEVGFYRTHCRVCEKELGDAKRNSRRELCGRRHCRNQFRSFRALFFSVWYPDATGASKPKKSPTKSTLKTGIKSHRGFAIGADHDREVVHDNLRTNATFWTAVLIGPNDPPVNILGGYKFPAALNIDLYPAASPIPNRPSNSNPYIAQIPDDLSIPAFLQRRPA